ncbi:MAG TPA: hypothetical protein VJY34_22460 [Roseiarcus sp.]|nr:hypothetical protein [Roseiarcus sp.]
MSATKREPCGLTRRQVIESGAALAVLGFVRAGFAAEVEPLAPPGDPGVGDYLRRAGGYADPPDVQA